MRTAIYNGKIINALDVKNKYKEFETNIYEEYKKAGQTGLLSCFDCGTEVYLKAGEIKVPHFAHKTSNRECFYELTNKETEEQRKGISLMYYWLKSQYGESVYLDRKYGNRRSNVSLQIENNIIALQFIRNERAINEWDSKRNDYSDMGIKDFYFFSYKEFNWNKSSEEQFRKIVQKYSQDNTIKMIDTDNDELMLMRYIDFYDHDKKLFYSDKFLKKYKIYEIKILSNGQIETDFENEYKNALNNHRNIAVKKWKKLKEKEREEAIRIKRNQVLKDKLLHGYEKIRNEESRVNHLAGSHLESSTYNDSHYQVSDEFLELHRAKYTNANGMSGEELDKELKKFIRCNLDADKEWIIGKSKPLKLIWCRHCRRYYSSDHCNDIKYHFGVCNNCRR